MALPHLLFGLGKPGTTAGFKSMLAFWAGGAGGKPGTTAGFKSMLAFWAGGAGVSSGVAPPVRGSIPAGDYSQFYDYWRKLADRERGEREPVTEQPAPAEPDSADFAQPPVALPVRRSAAVAEWLAQEPQDEARLIADRTRLVERKAIALMVDEEDDIEALLMVVLQ